MKRTVFLTALAACLLNGCSASPDNWLDSSGRTNQSQGTFQPTLRWWSAFHDPLLDQFVAEVASQNIDLKIARARLDQSRAYETVARSGFFPDISASGGAARGNTLTPSVIPIESGGSLQTITSGGFDATWEIDLFGKTSDALHAAEAQSAAREASIEDIFNAIIADLARAVIEWRQAEQTIRETNDLLKSQDDQVSLLRTRAKSGLIDESFAERAQAQRAQTATQLPLAEAAAKAAQYQIERLLNVKNDQIEQILAKADPLTISIPEPDKIIHINVDVLKDRPDVHIAEANLLVAQANLQEASDALWPQITFSSFFGVQNTDTGAASPFVISNPIWSLASAISMPILNFGRLQGAIKAADAHAQEAYLTYEQTTMLAVQETKTALSDYLNGINAINSQAVALKHRRDTVAIAKQRFDHGLTDMTDLTTAESELDQATLALIERKTNAAIAYIRLQKALGVI